MRARRYSRLSTTSIPRASSARSRCIPWANCDVPRLGRRVAAGDTLQTVAGQYGIDLDTLASVNAGVKDLFDSVSDPDLSVPHLSQHQAGALIEEMKRTLGVQHLSAMVS